MCCEHELWTLFIPLNSRLITGIRNGKSYAASHLQFDNNSTNQ